MFLGRAAPSCAPMESGHYIAVRPLAAGGLSTEKALDSLVGSFAPAANSSHINAPVLLINKVDYAEAPDSYSVYGIV